MNNKKGKTAFERLQAKVTDEHRKAVKKDLDRTEISLHSQHPRTFYEFVTLPREIEEHELHSTEKEGLIDLVQALKRRELDYYIKYHTLLNELEDLVKKFESHVDLYKNTGNVIAESATAACIEKLKKFTDEKR